MYFSYLREITLDKMLLKTETTYAWIVGQLQNTCNQAGCDCLALVLGKRITENVCNKLS